MKTHIGAVLAFGLILCVQAVQSKPLDLANTPEGPIGTYLAFLVEQGMPLDLDEAMQAHAAGQFSPSTDAVLNFGLGAKPAWIRFDVSNGESVPVTRRLSLAAPWLDQLDVFIVRDGHPVFSRRMGDKLPFENRPLASRFFGLDQVFEPGLTSVYIRVESIDPMVLPIYLSSIAQAEAREVREGYSYGLLYGGLLSLLVYNLLLFFSLRRRRYLVYTLYLAAFVLANMAYTGHAYRYLWPESPQWQQFSILLLMMLVILIGFLFATTFLNTRTAFPRHNRVVVVLCAVIGGAELLAVAAGHHLAAAMVSFSSVYLYAIGMILLGVFALRAGDKSARYYLGATISHVSTAGVVALAVLGFIPYTQLAYRAVEAGMMLDAILLAMALADQFRISQNQKLLAEQLAKVDPLTQLNNRRGFYHLAQPRWNNGVRKQHDMSVIVLDIDLFKRVNDRYGHGQGDRVLTEVARVLQSGLRDSDVAARWGGEEFILFLDETGLDDAMIIAERFRHAVAEAPLVLNGDRITITASLGVAQMKDRSGTIDDLIKRADDGLYKAKHLGRNQVCAGSE